MRKTAKIMRVIARLNVGGPAVHCLLLSEKLQAFGYETTLVTGHPESEEASYETFFGAKPSGFRLVRLGKLRRRIQVFGDLRTLWQLICLIRKEKPDIVHTHTAKAGMLGRVAATVCRVPIVVHTFHGHVLSGYFNRAVSQMFCWIERILAWKTTAIVTLSPKLRSELSEGFRVAPASRFRVIPLGRKLDSFFQAHALRGALREELGIAPETKIIGTMGRLVPIKDQRTLLAACQALPSELDWKLVVVGKGDLLQALQADARQRGIDQRVVFLGWRSDLARIYADLDVFVLSSLNEGTPLSMIEAFASGCPVVATDVGGVSDLFTSLEAAPPESLPQVSWRKEGALTPSKNPEVLSKAMAALLRNRPFARAASLAARERANQYTDTALTERMAALYEELLQA